MLCPQFHHREIFNTLSQQLPPPIPPQKTGGHSNLLFVLALLPVIGLGVAIYLCARRANYWKGNAAIATAGGLGLITIAAALMVVITPIIFCLRYLYQLLCQLPAHCCGSSHQIEI
ncbi:hypothetical protein L3404_00305 [Chlamydia trachomatis L3/404/LN]|nr:hypothetical protein L3404_00305 [Chlamydia trachomatis L3/404/LN]